MNQLLEGSESDPLVGRSSKPPSSWASVLGFGPGSPPLFVWGDMNGFFILFFNNLLNMSLLVTLFQYSHPDSGFTGRIIQERLLPGTGLSLLLGSLFYWWQGRRLAIAEGRDDVTAQPFGIATPSMFGFIAFIVKPALDAGLGFEAVFGLVVFCNFWSGIVEAGTGLYGNLVHRYVPTAALLAALAGIGLALISTAPLYEVLQSPFVGVIPFLLFLFFEVSGERLRTGLKAFPEVPSFLVVILIGVALGWIVNVIVPGYTQFPPIAGLTASYPYPAFAAFGRAFAFGAQYIVIFVPLALISGVGSLQCITSARTAGDVFHTPASLLVNGACTSLAALFGAPFPTAIFIGHPTIKKVGGRTGYMLLNGIFCFIASWFGFVNVFLGVVPMAAILPIVIYVGFDIMLLSVSSDEHLTDKPAMPRRHILAVLIAIVPPLANLSLAAATAVIGSVDKIRPHIFVNATPSNCSLAGVSAPLVADLAQSGYFLGGVIAITQGFLLTSMLWGATMTFWIDHRYAAATVTLVVLAVLAWIGLIHSYDLECGQITNVLVGQKGWIAAPGFVFSYGVMAAFSLAVFALKACCARRKPAGVINEDTK